ncbi:MAG: matrixin family metalloprotease [Deltaproteobacteria bacterium]|nr:matrixin family metalloprotease [Deltaproteobacteria bacterium]
MQKRILVGSGLALLVLACGDVGPDALGTAEVTPRPELASGAAADLEGIPVVAPEPGAGVFAEVVLDTGETRTLLLETGIDGRVFELALITELVDDAAAAEEPEEEGGVVALAAGEAPRLGSLAPCSDKSKSLLPYKVSGPLAWYFNSGSTPASNSAASVEKALKRTANNITTSRNSCSMTDQVSATYTFLGKTDAASAITADAQCGAGNGLNTVGFGALPKGVLGLACVYYDGADNVVEADIRLNKAYGWYGDKPANGSGRYSVEAVATHEFGHVFGLGHVAEAGHGNLTMSTAMNGTCQGSENTLGRRDVLGLRAMY